MSRTELFARIAAAALLALAPLASQAQATRPLDVDKARVIEHWTPDRMASAIPRDLVVDPRGLGYLRQRDGRLVPYGHDVPAQAAAPASVVSPFGGTLAASADKVPPEIASMDPAGGTIGSSYTFSAFVTDPSGVKSVTFKIRNPGGTTQSFSAANVSGTKWSVSLQGFTDGNWSWWVVAKDGARPGNTATSSPVYFKVSTGSGGGGSGSVASARWTGGGVVQAAVGRLYFEMPANRQMTRWQGYVCSGTVVNDAGAAGSRILTAAHCVYDDVYKAFAINVMFVPDQAATTGAGTDLVCTNDRFGCWIPGFGVVDRNWTLRTFPDNVAWDYAFYVVADSGAHRGNAAPSDALDQAVTPMTMSVAKPQYDNPAADADFTHAFGYSYDVDPNFMYCADHMTTAGSADWWLPACALTGGSSGGPWVQPMTGSSLDPVISVNSWGYTNQPGMAGPKFWGTSADCVFTAAKSASADGGAGTTADCGAQP